MRLKQEMGGKAQSALELKRACKDGSILDIHLWTASLVGAEGRNHRQHGDSRRYHRTQAGRRGVTPASRTPGPGPRCYYRSRPEQPHHLLECRSRKNLWLEKASPRCRGKKPITSFTRGFPNRKRNWKPSFSARGNGRVNCRIPGGMAAASSWPAAGLCNGTRRASPPLFWKLTGILPGRSKPKPAGTPGRYSGSHFRPGGHRRPGGQGALSQPGRPENVGYRGG